jgi:hypothetical protein
VRIARANARPARRGIPSVEKEVSEIKSCSAAIEPDAGSSLATLTCDPHIAYGTVAAAAAKADTRSRIGCLLRGLAAPRPECYDDAGCSKPPSVREKGSTRLSIHNRSPSFCPSLADAGRCAKEGASISLPDRPSLEWLRKTAKHRLSELRGTNPNAKLAEAQLAVARENGFSSWRALKAHIDNNSGQGPRDTAAPALTEEAVKTFLEHVGTGRIGDVRAMLAATPALVNAVGPHPFWGGRPQALHVAIEAKRARSLTCCSTRVPTSTVPTISTTIGRL